MNTNLNPKLIELGFEVMDLKSLVEKLTKEKLALQSSLHEKDKSLNGVITHNDELYKLKNELLAVTRQRDESIRSEDKLDKSLRNLTTKLSMSEKERKELKSLDPIRLKKQITKLKSNVSKQRDTNELVLKDKEGASKEVALMRNTIKSLLDETDFFYTSEDKLWALKLTGFRYLDEDKNKRTLRIRCLDRSTGQSWVANDISEDGSVNWGGQNSIPDYVSEEANDNMTSLHEHGTLKGDDFVI
jgi:chromosome segregation ATPase